MENNRLPLPESAVAESFTQDIDSMFGLSTTSANTSTNTNANNTVGLDGLSETVEEKKRNVSSQSQELAALEARLRETEERLARVSESSPEYRNASKYRDSVTGAPNQQSHTQAYNEPSSVPRSAQSTSQQSQYPQSAAQETIQARPYNTRGDSLGLPPMPGAMPVTPQEYSGNDYVAANRTR